MPSTATQSLSGTQRPDADDAAKVELGTRTSQSITPKRSFSSVQRGAMRVACSSGTKWHNHPVHSAQQHRCSHRKDGPTRACSPQPTSASMAKCGRQRACGDDGLKRRPQPRTAANAPCRHMSRHWPRPTRRRTRRATRRCDETMKQQRAVKA